MVTEDEGNSDVRELELNGKVFTRTRETIDALAWATNRRGRITWTDPLNVTTKIIKYLRDHNVSLPVFNDERALLNHYRNVIDRLVVEGWAESKAGGSRDALTMFKFKDDVVLSGHEPQYNTPIVKVGEDTGTINDLLLDVPLPSLPSPPRYKLEEVNKLLDTWADKDTEGYATWVDSLVQRLGVLLNG